LKEVEIMNILKKMLIITLMLFSSFSICFADVFDDNTSQYIPIGSTMDLKEYLDINSVQVIRYDPPYYIIQADAIVKYYTHGTILRITSKYFYNYNTKVIQAQDLSMIACNENGETQGNVVSANSTVWNIRWDNPRYKEADLIFKKAYDIPFNNIVN